MAKVSKTPGKTRALEVFLSALPCVLVDLPGYGFASRSQEERQRWATLIQGYLQVMPTLKGIVIIVDGRHPPFEADLQMMDWVESRNLQGVILLNKWDAATQSERDHVKKAWEALIRPEGWRLIPVSCKTGYGIHEVESILKSWGRRGAAE
jgi:GTP-binding protein